jgi:hypothetical protein
MSKITLRLLSVSALALTASILAASPGMAFSASPGDIIVAQAQGGGDAAAIKKDPNKANGDLSSNPNTENGSDALAAKRPTGTGTNPSTVPNMAKGDLNSNPNTENGSDVLAKQKPTSGTAPANSPSSLAKGDLNSNPDTENGSDALAASPQIQKVGKAPFNGSVVPNKGK